MTSGADIERLILERLAAIEELLREHADLERERARLERALRALHGEPARPHGPRAPCEARLRPARLH